ARPGRRTRRSAGGTLPRRRPTRTAWAHAPHSCRHRSQGDRQSSPSRPPPRLGGMYAVQLAFSDDPARLEGRPAHREKLAAHVAAGRLLAAGPFSDESGALLVFLVDDRAAIDEIVADDPYYSGHGGSAANVHEPQP